MVYQISVADHAAHEDTWERERVAIESYKRATGKADDMELRVMENTDEELSIEIGGEDHTFMNVLKGALLETEGVTTATYDMNPEQSGGQTEPILAIKTDDTTEPLDALEEGAGRVREKTTAFKQAFDAAA